MPSISPSAKSGDGNSKPMRKTKCRNAYQREMQRIYRKAEADERQRLRDQAAVLEAKVAVLRPAASTLLPWQHVAISLRDELDASHTTHADLRRRVRRINLLAHLMHAYASSVLASSTLLRGRTETWQHVSLPAAMPARALGLDWITRQLYYNTDAVLSQHAFPPCTTREGQTFFDIAVSDTDATVVIRHQRLVARPLAVLTAAYHEFFIGGNGFGYAIEDLDTLPATENMVYRRRNVGNRVLGDLVQNYVHRQFTAPTRSVLVARNILSDDKVPLGLYKRDASGWVVATAMGADTTLVQEVWSICPLLKGASNDVAPFADEACLYGLDLRTLPPALHFSALQQAVHRLGQSVLAKRAQFFDTVR
ncbi:hypothetical protein SDRG_08824 [Saprolegnia diclina VS20]|uniref:Uncharacterized protein n=1 Tax=Saprolegnia diclina (strain VS20) TaxID=1156394 RepID=T0QG50_SAPDV|nr:hypothetical protein SDRG_08824 [Saprolegnia diclina VS20]EQC33721.1 hypothetical protein SDRG_08824 [Saprolegnia diclina VS20]|eukprot:XP_008612944.1 hypothetical protein SDRG_08824 [Saprolegnia diclina VS20]